MAKKQASTTTAIATVDQGTGEILNERPMALVERPTDPNYMITPRGEEYGAVAVDSRAASVLQANLTDDEVDILPTGEVYLSQIGYRRRLNEAFGPGSWVLVPEGDPVQLGISLAQRWHLYILGRHVSVAYGEAEYHSDNPRQTWATAWESAKSNALMRLCKDLGVASECWDRRWTQLFKERCCVSVWRKNERKPQWRRLDATPWYDETGVAAQKDVPEAFDVEKPVEGSRPVPTSTASAPTNGGATTNGGGNGYATGSRGGDTRPITEKQGKRLFAITKAREQEIGFEVAPSLKDHLVNDYGYNSWREIQAKDYEAIVAWVQKFTAGAPPAREPGDEPDDPFGEERT